jgi:hypothetical protein
MLKRSHTRRNKNRSRSAHTQQLPINSIAHTEPGTQSSSSQMVAVGGCDEGKQLIQSGNSSLSQHIASTRDSLAGKSRRAGGVVQIRRSVCVCV